VPEGRGSPARRVALWGAKGTPGTNLSARSGGDPSGSRGASKAKRTLKIAGNVDRRAGKSHSRTKFSGRFDKLFHSNNGLRAVPKAPNRDSTRPTQPSCWQGMGTAPVHCGCPDQCRTTTVPRWTGIAGDGTTGPCLSAFLLGPPRLPGQGRSPGLPGERGYLPR